MKSKKLIFFGSGQLGLDALAKLKSEFEISLVVTKNRPEYHKGAMPVFDYCLDNNLELITPSSKAELDQQLIPFLDQNPNIKLGVVVDYGIIISEQLINKFELGILNSHFSLLPSWRGADPITFPVLAGDELTGVTFMMINKGMDTGQLLQKFEIKISDSDDQLSLTEKLSEVSCSEVIGVVNKLFDHKFEPLSQPKYLITYSRMLAKSEAQLDVRKPASLLAREVRAFSVWPKTKLNIYGYDCIIKEAEQHLEPKIDLTPGQLKLSGDALFLGCGRGSCLKITELQPAGKKSMSAADFIRGYIKQQP